MNAASALEHLLLLERDRLLAQELTLVNPVWVGSGIDTMQIYSETQFRQILRTVAMAEGLSIEDTSRLPPLAAAVVGLIAHTPEGARTDFTRAMADRDQLMGQADDPDNPCDTLAVSNGVVMIPNAGIPGQNVHTLPLPLRHCLSQCQGTPWCITVDFQRANNTCYLHDVSGLRADIRYDYGGTP